jgi:hypothetical protein
VKWSRGQGCAATQQAGSLRRFSACLQTEANKPRKQKRTVKQLHAELMSLGYDGSYNRVAAFVRE